jgi:hypothetical protein
MEKSVIEFYVVVVICQIDSLQESVDLARTKFKTFTYTLKCNMARIFINVGIHCSNISHTYVQLLIGVNCKVIQQ